MHEYFTGLASTYSAHRPTYPGAAVRAALAGLPRPVPAVDVGCGTGISTRLLAAAGAYAIGIDPNEEMLGEARRHAPPPAGSVRYRRGTAENTGLETGSAGLVLCAQSFHWFDRAAALAEFHRILIPGGRLALLWNRWESTTPMGRGYERIVRAARAHAAASGMGVRDRRTAETDETGHFGPGRVTSYPNPQRLDRSGLLGRARSASYFPREGPEKDRIERELAALFDEHAEDGLVTLPQRAELTLAESLHATD